MEGVRKDVGYARIMSHRGPFRVAVAIVTLWSFLFSTIGNSILIENAWATKGSLGSTNIFLNRTNSSGVSSGKIDIGELQIPLRFGEIKDTIKGTNGKTIIHIQDAHCNYSAQHSIANIIDHLYNTYNVDLVMLEGGKGDYDLSTFTKIKDQDIREKVSDYFVKEGRLSGAEFFAVNNPRKATLFGVEDVKPYMANLKAYRNSLKFKEEADKRINSLSHIIANFKRKVYSAELKELDEVIRTHKEKKTNFKKYVTLLTDKAISGKVDLAQFKDVDTLLKLLKDEKSVDFKKANTERSILIGKLNSKLSQLELERLVTKTVEIKAGDITSEDFYSFLFKKANFANIDFSTLPNLVKYSDYVQKYEIIDKAKLFKEIKSLENTLMQNLLKTDDQKTLYALDTNLSIIKGMFNIALVKEDFDYYNANKGSFKIDNFLKFITKTGPLYKLNFKVDDKIRKLDSYRKNMEKFYAYSLKRDKAFMKNIGSKLKKENNNVTILVTGGFHTGNLKQLFQKNGYAYIGVMPKFAMSDEEAPYFRLLSGGKSQAETIVESAISNIAVAPMLRDMGIRRAVYNNREIGIFELTVEFLAALESGEGITIRNIGGWLRFAFKEEAPEFAERWEVGEVTIKGEKKSIYATRLKHESVADVPGKAVRVTEFDESALSVNMHQAVVDLLIQMAYDETYEDLERHSLSDLLKEGSELSNKMAELIGAENVAKAREISRDADIGIVTGKNGAVVPWRFGHHGRGSGKINLTNSRDDDDKGIERLTATLLHELNYVFKGKAHSENISYESFKEDPKKAEAAKNILKGIDGKSGGVVTGDTDLLMASADDEFSRRYESDKQKIARLQKEIDGLTAELESTKSGEFDSERQMGHENALWLERRNKLRAIKILQKRQVTIKPWLDEIIKGLESDIDDLLSGGKGYQDPDFIMKLVKGKRAEIALWKEGKVPTDGTLPIGKNPRDLTMAALPNISGENANKNDEKQIPLKGGLLTKKGRRVAYEASKAARIDADMAPQVRQRNRHVVTKEDGTEVEEVPITNFKPWTIFDMLFTGKFAEKFINFALQEKERFDRNRQKWDNSTADEKKEMAKRWKETENMEDWAGPPRVLLVPADVMDGLEAERVTLEDVFKLGDNNFAIASEKGNIVQYGDYEVAITAEKGKEGLLKSTTDDQYVRVSAASLVRIVVTINGKQYYILQGKEKQLSKKGNAQYQPFGGHAYFTKQFVDGGLEFKMGDFGIISEAWKEDADPEAKREMAFHIPKGNLDRFMKFYLSEIGKEKSDYFASPEEVVLQEIGEEIAGQGAHDGDRLEILDKSVTNVETGPLSDYTYDAYTTPEMATDALVNILINTGAEINFDMIGKAINMAKESHNTTPVRDDGRPYLFHPIEIALHIALLFKLGHLDADVNIQDIIIAALLHDYVEEKLDEEHGDKIRTKVEDKSKRSTHYREIESLKNDLVNDVRSVFGDEVAGIVDDLTEKGWMRANEGRLELKLEHLSRVKNSKRKASRIIKVVDRVHNMRTNESDKTPAEKERRMAVKEMDDWDKFLREENAIPLVLLAETELLLYSERMKSSRDLLTADLPNADVTSSTIGLLISSINVNASDENSIRVRKAVYATLGLTEEQSAALWYALHDILRNNDFDQLVTDPVHALKRVIESRKMMVEDLSDPGSDASHYAEGRVSVASIQRDITNLEQVIRNIEGARIQALIATDRIGHLLSSINLNARDEHDIKARKAIYTALGLTEEQSAALRYALHDIFRGDAYDLLATDPVQALQRVIESKEKMAEDLSDPGSDASHYAAGRVSVAGIQEDIANLEQVVSSIQGFRRDLITAALPVRLSQESLPNLIQEYIADVGSDTDVISPGHWRVGEKLTRQHFSDSNTIIWAALELCRRQVRSYEEEEAEIGLESPDSRRAGYNAAKWRKAEEQVQGLQGGRDLASARRLGSSPDDMDLGRESQFHELYARVLGDMQVVAEDWTRNVGSYYNRDSDDPYYSFHAATRRGELKTLQQFGVWMKEMVANLRRVQSKEESRRGSDWNRARPVYARAISGFEALIREINAFEGGEIEVAEVTSGDINQYHGSRVTIEYSRDGKQGTVTGTVLANSNQWFVHITNTSPSLDNSSFSWADHITKCWVGEKPVSKSSDEQTALGRADRPDLASARRPVGLSRKDLPKLIQDYITEAESDTDVIHRGDDYGPRSTERILTRQHFSDSNTIIWAALELCRRQVRSYEEEEAGIGESPDSRRAGYNAAKWRKAEEQVQGLQGGRDLASARRPQASVSPIVSLGNQLAEEQRNLAGQEEDAAGEEARFDAYPDSGRPLAGKANNWDGWLDTNGVLGGVITGTRKATTQNLFENEGGHAFINVVLNENLSGGEYLTSDGRIIKDSRTTKVKNLVNKLIRMSNFGRNVTIEVHADNDAAMKAIAKQRRDLGDTGVSVDDIKKRIVTFAHIRDEQLQTKSFTVYLEGETQENQTVTPTPIAAIGMAGLRILNYFDTVQKFDQGKAENADVENATHMVAQGLVGISGSINRDLVKKLVEKIVANGGLLNFSGKLFVKLRAINWGEIVEFHEREAEVLRAL